MVSSVAGDSDAGGTPSSRWMNRLATAVTLVLILVMADRLSVLTWMVVPKPEIDAPPSTLSPGSGAPDAPARATGYGGLADLHLLGEVRTAAAPKPRVVERAPEVVPETRLQLTLTGVYHADDANAAIAIIAAPGGREEIYHVGDSLPGNVTLEEIGRQRVVLSRDGKLEALTFPRESGISGQPAARRPTSRSTEPARRINAQPLIGRYLEQANDNPDALLDVAQIEPVIEEGAFRGFRLRPGRKRSLLRRLGLQSGDVVTTINGTPLDNLPRAMEQIQGLANASVVEATIVRNGEQIPYTFALK